MNRTLSLDEWVNLSEEEKGDCYKDLKCAPILLRSGYFYARFSMRENRRNRMAKDDMDLNT